MGGGEARGEARALCVCVCGLGGFGKGRKGLRGHNRVYIVHVHMLSVLMTASYSSSTVSGPSKALEQWYWVSLNHHYGCG